MPRPSVTAPLKPPAGTPMQETKPVLAGGAHFPMPRSSEPRSDTPSRCQVCAAQRVCMIGQLPQAQRSRLDPMIQERAFRKGDVLQAQTTVSDQVRTLKIGTVMLTREGPDGVSRPVAMVGRGHPLGLMALLGQPLQVGAQALSAGRYCELPAAALRNVLVSEPAHLDRLHQRVAATLAVMADWAQVMRLRGLPRQLVATLILLAHEQGSRTVALPSHVALAEVLRTSRETVARTLAQLAQRGHVHRNDRWHVTLAPGHIAVFTEPGPPPE